MNSEIIFEVATKTLAGAMSFPDAVGNAIVPSGTKIHHSPPPATS
jgi:hypothetical protein